MKRIFGVALLSGALLAIGVSAFAQTSATTTNGTSTAITNGTSTDMTGTTTSTGTTTTNDTGTTTVNGTTTTTGGTGTTTTSGTGSNSSTSTTMGGGSVSNSTIAGTVVAVNGSTITIQTVNNIFTVNATNVPITKSGQTSTTSSISVGDTVNLQVQVNGASITTTTVNVNGHRNVILGNGQPIVGGTVSAINASNGSTTLMLTTRSGITYTVDATNAKVMRGTAMSSLSSILVGDQVFVQGMVNGTQVTASTVLDGGTASHIANRAIFQRMGVIFTRLLQFFGF